MNLRTKAPSKNEYENALKVVEKYEKRQGDLKQLAKDLSYKLSQFSNIQFKIDKKKGEIIFTGLHKKSNKLLIGQSVCKSSDEYAEVIGKMIAVKVALHENISEIVKMVEPKYCFAKLISVDSICAINNKGIRIEKQPIEKQPFNIDTFKPYGF